MKIYFPDCQRHFAYPLASRSVFYSFILCGSLAWQFTSKTNLNRVFILQKKCLRIITFSFYKDRSNPLFKDLKLLKLRDVLESEIIKFFYKFSRNELPKSVCSIFNLVHEVHTRNTRNNLLIYISRMSTSRYGNHSLRGDGASLWNKFFKDFFPSHDLTSFFKLKSLLMKRFLETSDARSNNFLLIFSPKRFFMKCSPATQSSNFMTEILKVN